MKFWFLAFNIDLQVHKTKLKLESPTMPPNLIVVIS